MLIRIRQLTKTYTMGTEKVHALRGVDLDIAKNEFVAIMGASGSGKSTLMNILGCLDQPTSGTYDLNDKSVHKMSAGSLSQVRNEEIGFVFQSFELLGRATALRNVELPLIYSRKRFWGSTKRAKEALHKVGLGERMTHKPSQLSGGQKQRVAIARALVNGPSILLADEPTGALDSKTSEDIMALFQQLHKDGQTVIIVTHEEDIAGYAKRIVRLKDGRILSDNPTDTDPIHQDFLKRSLESAQRAAGVPDSSNSAQRNRDQEEEEKTLGVEGKPLNGLLKIPAAVPIVAAGAMTALLAPNQPVPTRLSPDLCVSVLNSNQQLPTPPGGLA
jgi:putative ABC transport system ATP-binding protein